MASSRALLYLYLAVVAASGQLCERNSQCDMAGGEWCGSHESCGDEDCCISSVPCDVTTSSAHSCLTCSLEFDVTFVITEDCVCLNAELSVDECSDAFARGTPREVADDDDDDDDEEEEYDAEWTWTAGLMSCYGAALAVAAHAARLRWAAADAAAAGAKRAAAAGGKRRVDTTTTTGVRALLMLVIAVGHMNAFGGAGRVAGHMGFRGELGGGAAVEGFFLVSGFVMALAYSRQDFVGSGPGDVVALARRRNFYAKRFARLAPLYYLSELLMCLLRMDPWGLALLPFSLTGITSWTLIVYPNNGVLWSVSTIAFFYYRLPWLFGRLERAWTRAHLPWLAALMAVKWSLVGVDPFFYMPLRVWPPFVVPVFMVGAIVGRSRLEDALAGGDPSPALWGRRADALSVALALFVGVSAFFSHYAGAFGLRVVLEAFIILPLAYWIEALTYAGSASWVGFVLSARRRPAAFFREIATARRHAAAPEARRLELRRLLLPHDRHRARADGPALVRVRRRLRRRVRRDRGGRREAARPLAHGARAPRAPAGRVAARETAVLLPRRLPDLPALRRVRPRRVRGRAVVPLLRARGRVRRLEPLRVLELHVRLRARGVPRPPARGLGAPRGRRRGRRRRRRGAGGRGRAPGARLARVAPIPKKQSRAVVKNAPSFYREQAYEAPT